MTLLRSKMSSPGAVRLVGPIKRKKMLHIYGLDAVTTVEDVKEDMKKHCVDQAVVKNLRPLKYGALQAASVLVDEVTAEKLAKLGQVRIGLSYCRVKVRPDIQTCFRCWGTGNMAAHCHGVDRSRLCRNCGEEGHEAKGCTGSPKCPLCNAPGHRATTLKCPKYSEAAGEGVLRKSSPPRKRRAAGAGVETPGNREPTEIAQQGAENVEERIMERAQTTLGESPDRDRMQLD